MSGWIMRMKDRVPVRLRMSFGRLFVMVVTWLAVGGAADVIRGEDERFLLFLGAAVVGCGLYGMFGSVPPDHRQPAE